MNRHTRAMPLDVVNALEALHVALRSLEPNMRAQIAAPVDDALARYREHAAALAELVGAIATARARATVEARATELEREIADEAAARRFVRGRPTAAEMEAGRRGCGAVLRAIAAAERAGRRSA